MSGFVLFLMGGLLILAIGYVVLAPVFFTSWLKLYRLDTQMDQEARQLSWIVLAIATLFWPLVVPLAYLSLLRKQYQERAALEVLDAAERDSTRHNSEPFKAKH